MVNDLEDNNENLKLEEHLKVIRSILEPRLVVDRFGKICSANRYACDLFGYNEDELLGKSIEILVPILEEEHRLYREKYMRRPHPKIMSTNKDFVSKRKDGTTFKSYILLTPLYIPDVFVIVEVRDTTVTTEMYNQTLEGWGKALNFKDKNTSEHTDRVTKMTVNFCKILGFDKDELINVWRGAMLHDVGKIGIPDHILLKEDNLTEAEWEIMRQHPLYAKQMLEDIRFLLHAIPIPYCHHENWDGTGYPLGLVGAIIPLEARAFKLVDVFDALINDRIYRKAWSKEKTIEYIKENSGTLFDPVLVDMFVNNLKTILEELTIDNI